MPARPDIRADEDWIEVWRPRTFQPASAVQTLDYICTASPIGDPMSSRGVVRKNVRLTQRKIDEAKKILGTETETETIERALDLVVFGEEVVAGLERISGTGAIEDIHELLDSA